MTDAINTPAARIIARFSVEKLSRWTGRHRSRVHAWAWPVDRGGTGGVVPPRVRQSIITAAADELGEAITFQEFEPRSDEGYLEPTAPASAAAHAGAAA